jgi:hypothetical protein
LNAEQSRIIASLDLRRAVALVGDADLWVTRNANAVTKGRRVITLGALLLRGAERAAGPGAQRQTAAMSDRPTWHPRLIQGDGSSEQASPRCAVKPQVSA